MPDFLSKELLKAFVEGFIDRSTALQIGAFTRTQIAKAVFPQHQTTETAKSHFSKLYSSSNPRPLSAEDLEATLAACRKLLWRQFTHPAFQENDPELRVLAFERDLCLRLGIAGTTGRVTIADFRCDQQLEDAITPLDFGFPDMTRVDDLVPDIALRIKRTQANALEMLRRVVPRIPVSGSDERRLQLMHVAVSAASLHHPGTRSHDEATDLALTGAGHAQLHRLISSHRTDESLRATAIRLNFSLYYNHLGARFNSPTNYLNYAMRGHPLPERVWQRVRFSLEQAILDSDRYVEMVGNDVLANRYRSSILSMKARLMAVLPNEGARREADRVHAASIPFMEKLPEPYGFIYPIIKDIVAGKLKSAIRRCEQASAVLEQAQSPSAIPFAAWHVILTHRLGGSATADKHLIELARRANASPVIQYKYSHVFDAKDLRAALKTVRPHDPLKARRRKT